MGGCEARVAGASRHETEAQRVVEKVQRVIGPLQTHLDKLVYRCCLVVPPSRLDQDLETLCVGRKLDFHESLRDELTNEDDRTRLPVHLRSHPTAVHSLVDVETRMIHHVAGRSRRRVASYLRPVARSCSVLSPSSPLR